MNIAIVEDNIGIGDLYVTVLSELGHAAWAFRDGESFLDALPALSPDVLVVDRTLPGIDGLQVAQRVRVQRPGVPILMVSGAAMPEPGSAGAAAIDGFLAKPCTISQFTAAVHDLGAAQHEATRG